MPTRTIEPPSEFRDLSRALQLRVLEWLATQLSPHDHRRVVEADMDDPWAVFTPVANLADIVTALIEAWNPASAEEREHGEAR